MKDVRVGDISSTRRYIYIQRLSFSRFGHKSRMVARVDSPRVLEFFPWMFTPRRKFTRLNLIVREGNTGRFSAGFSSFAGGRISKSSVIRNWRSPPIEFSYHPPLVPSFPSTEKPKGWKIYIYMEARIPWMEKRVWWDSHAYMYVGRSAIHRLIKTACSSYWSL